MRTGHLNFVNMIKNLKLGSEYGKLNNKYTFIAKWLGKGLEGVPQIAKMSKTPIFLHLDQLFRTYQQILDSPRDRVGRERISNEWLLRNLSTLPLAHFPLLTGYFRAKIRITISLKYYHNKMDVITKTDYE